MAESSSAPKVPDEAVEVAAIRAYNRTFGRDDAARDLWCMAGQYTHDHYRDQVRRGIEDALPVIHAERDREVTAALDQIAEIWRGDERDYERQGYRYLARICRDKLEALTLIRERLDSLQVSGAAQPDTTEVIAEIGEALAADQPDQDRSPGEVDELVERLREYVPPAEPQPGTDEAARNRQQYRRDLIAAIERLAAQQPDPQDQEGGARKAASRAVEEQARGTLEEQGLKPDDAAYLVALARKRGEEMSAIDTDEPPQPDTSHGDREGER